MLLRAVQGVHVGGSITESNDVQAASLATKHIQCSTPTITTPAHNLSFSGTPVFMTCPPDVSVSGGKQEDWGELYTGKRAPAIFILDLRTWSVQRLAGMPPDCSAGQPVWAPSGAHAPTAAWLMEHQPIPPAHGHRVPEAVSYKGCRSLIASQCRLGLSVSLSVAPLASRRWMC